MWALNSESVNERSLDQGISIVFGSAFTRISNGVTSMSVQSIRCVSGGASDTVGMAISVPSSNPTKSSLPLLKARTMRRYSALSHFISPIRCHPVRVQFIPHFYDLLQMLDDVVENVTRR